MGYDPDGTWDWGKFKRIFTVVAIAVVAVVAIAVITAATGGAAAPVLVSAGIGAATSGGTSVVTQLATTDKVDLGQLFVDIAVGGVMGAFGGSTLGMIGMGIAGGVTGFAGSVANDIVAGDEINWTSALIAGGIGAAFGLLSGGGAQHGKNSALKAKLNERKVRIAKDKSIRSINSQIKSEVKLLSKAAIKSLIPNTKLGLTLILQFEVNSIAAIFLP